MLPSFGRRYILNGEPVARSYEDLWSQIFLLDHGASLGATVTGFRAKYFTETMIGGKWPVRTLKPGAADAIQAAISHLVTYVEQDPSLYPDVVVSDRYCELPSDALSLYRTFEADFVASVNGTQVSAVSAGALSMKLRQVVNGHVYDDFGGSQHMHRAKLEELESIVEEAQGEPVLCAVAFRSDVDCIRGHFGAQVPYIGGGISTKESDAVCAAWNRGDVPLLLVHPASAGYGLNLQAGGAILVWYALPWSLDEYRQTNARLARPGQARAVSIIRLLAKGTIDERVAKVLNGRAETQQNFLDSLLSLS
jgi:SNF2 family DNA or RNA helicase